MLSVGTDSTSAGYSITRLLLAGSSRKSALLTGAHAEQTKRLGRVTAPSPFQPQVGGKEATADDRAQLADAESRFGPAAVFEPSEHARATALRRRGNGTEAPSASDAGGLDPPALSEEEQKQVEELKRRDAEVRQHEAAHKAAAGPHASGGPSFEFQAGPDGRRYAVGGEVQIDTSPVSGNPRATIAKMQQIRRAALAPANPSAQDRSVAAQSAKAEREARAELAQQNTDDSTTSESADPNTQSGRSGPPGQFIDVTA